MNTSSQSLRRFRDPRYYQIAALSGLVVYGITVLDFEVTWMRAIAILGSVLLFQYLCTRFWGLPVYDPKSALISGLSLCLLLRTTSPAVAIFAAFVAVASKFLIRWDGKHLFNPTNLAVVLMLLLFDDAWVSGGQWGSTALLAFAVAGIGMLVVFRAARSDVTIAFLIFYAAVLFGRSLWLGEPMTIPLHRMQSGALILFSFFMISDPKTTPDSRAGRIIFALLVALGAGYVQFFRFGTNALLWSLVVMSPLVPILDKLLPGRHYEWWHRLLDKSPQKGGAYESAHDSGGGRPVPAVVNGGMGVLRFLRSEGRHQAL